MVVDYDWRWDSVCKGMASLQDNPFFQEGRGETYQLARELCSTCPVVVDCLMEGLKIDNPVGFWGCMSPNERAGIRRTIKLKLPIKKAVEEVWSYHRRSGERKAPPSSVWNEWNV